MEGFVTLEEAEREHIVSTLERLDWNAIRAAMALGCCVKTVYNRLHAYEAEGFVICRCVGKTLQWSRASRKPEVSRTQQQGIATGSTDGEEVQEAARRARAVVSG